MDANTMNPDMIWVHIICKATKVPEQMIEQTTIHEQEKKLKEGNVKSQRHGGCMFMFY